MLKLTSHKLPIYQGVRQANYIHIAYVDKKGYEELIDTIDADDADAGEWYKYEEFAGLAYEREVLSKKANDWWIIFSAEVKLTVGTIAHESLHIARMILTSRGVRFDPSNDEPYAYMVGYIADLIADDLQKFVEIPSTIKSKNESKTRVSKRKQNK